MTTPRLRQIGLSCNSKKALTKGAIVSIVTALSYLLIVVVTTPSLPPATAINTALVVNSPILFGTAIGIGAQVFMSSYGNGLGCPVKREKDIVAMGSGGTAFSSFLSFFPLVPLGCCGSWLYILSFLPSILGATLSVTLIQYSTLLSYTGLAIIFAFTGLQALRLSKEMKRREGSGQTMPAKNGDFHLVGKKILNKKRIAWIAVTAAIAITIIIGITAVTTLARFHSSSDVSGDDNTAGRTGSASSEQKALVPLDQIVSGGPPRDGIPSIDNPKFVSVQDSEKFLQDSDLVIGLHINGDVRAYPLQILVWHEIVNDRVGGVPVAITYCPLCFTSQVFKRMIETDRQVTIEFGTSGKLYNSNLVMYDRTSQSYWNQALGQAITGKHTGTILERIPFDLATWKDWKQEYPESKVLSRETGFSRPYGVDPYGIYYTSPRVLFPLSHQDDRLGPKEIVVSLGSGGTYKAYRLTQIENDKAINDKINGNSLVLFSLRPFMVRAYDITVDGRTLDFEYNIQDGNFVDNQTKSHWNFDGVAIDGPMKGKKLSRVLFDEGFWFEWATFHPETEIYGK